MDRRTFIARITAATGIAGFCSLPFGVARLLAPGVAEASEACIPLPGALASHAAFVDACIGCGVCGEVCPPRCIKFHANDGGKEANTPYINPVEKGCTLCGLCMEFCPTEALVVTPIREIKMGIAQIDRAACYPWVDRGVCGACLNICPLGTDAIRTELGTFRPVIQEGCVGCGLCVEICPEPSLPIKIVDYSLSTKAYFEKKLEQQKARRSAEENKPEQQEASRDQGAPGADAGLLKY